MLKVVADGPGAVSRSALDEIVLEGARRMLAAALEAEVAAYIDRHVDEVDENGRRLVVRNGHAEPRQVKTAAGAVEIEAPRANDRRFDPATGQRERFASSIVPPWCRSTPKVVELLPLLYLHGMSSGDFSPALEGFFGTGAGLSPSAITRLTRQWQDEHRAFHHRSLAERDYVYVWADGVHFNVRLDEARLCALVIVGVRLDGTKELVAIADGLRESTDSWADLLRDLRRRGMRPPMIAVGDGALGFWAAVRDVWPETVAQRCWVHKNANVLSALPKAMHPSAKRMLADIRDAASRRDATTAINAFTAEFGAKWPKAAAKIVDDAEQLLAFYDFPAEHWIHLKPSNPIWVLSWVHRCMGLPSLRSVEVAGPDSESDWRVAVLEIEVSGSRLDGRDRGTWLERSVPAQPRYAGSPIPSSSRYAHERRTSIGSRMGCCRN